MKHPDPNGGTLVVTYIISLAIRRQRSGRRGRALAADVMHVPLARIAADERLRPSGRRPRCPCPKPGRNSGTGLRLPGREGRAALRAGQATGGSDGGCIPVGSGTPSGRKAGPEAGFSPPAGRGRRGRHPVSRMGALARRKARRHGEDGFRRDRERRGADRRGFIGSGICLAMDGRRRSSAPRSRSNPAGGLRRRGADEAWCSRFARATATLRAGRGERP